MPDSVSARPVPQCQVGIGLRAPHYRQFLEQRPRVEAVPALMAHMLARAAAMTA